MVYDIQEIIPDGLLYFYIYNCFQINRTELVLGKNWFSIIPILILIIFNERIGQLKSWYLKLFSRIWIWNFTKNPNIT